MGALLTADGLLALATLSAMEIVLGIDNVVFIAILVGRLPEAQRELARRLGLILALGIRVLLLFAITWMMGLTAPLFSVLGHGVSGRDLILLGGGLFLIFKATWEIYDKVEAGHHEQAARRRAISTSRWPSRSWWSWSTCATGASRARRSARRPRAPLPRSAGG